VRTHSGSFRRELMLALVLLGVSCKARTPPPKPEPSPPLSQGVGFEGQLAAEVPSAQALATGEPKDPYRSFAPGLLVRTRFAPPADKDARYAIEIWDAMVAPGKASEKARLPSSAVIEVRSGTGVLTVGGTPHELRAGTTAIIDDGADFTLTSTDKDAPLILRAAIIRAVRP
jgi:mannose-6-phosphate isomerase-like protein (cupin superfamily)